MAFTINRGTVKVGDNPFKLNRISIFSNTSIEEFKEIVGVK